MDTKKIQKRIRKAYEDEGSKPFIVHLIRKFLPISDKTSEVHKKPEKTMVCCLTGIKLYSADDVPQLITEKSTELEEQLKAGKSEAPVSHNIAMTSPDSDKYLCKEALAQLNIFVQNELLNGNKNMNWVLRDEREKSAPKEIAGAPDKKEIFARVK